MRRLRWVIYGAYNGAQLEYIGQTRNLKKRSQYHRWRSKWARKCEFRILAGARSEAAARKIEAALIWQHQPPRNAHLMPKPCVCAMPYEEAREVWFGNPTIVDWALFKDMPGWDYHRAIRAFGPRERKLIWRKPTVADDGTTRIRPKWYRVFYHPETIRRKQQD